MKLCLLILGLIAGLAAGDSHTEAPPNAGNPELLARYPNFLVLISNTYELYWKYTEGTSRLDIAVRVKTTGWVGLGVSEKGSMVNSDLAVGWVTNEGETVLQVSVFAENGSLAHTVPHMRTYKYKELNVQCTCFLDLHGRLPASIPITVDTIRIIYFLPTTCMY